MKRTRRIAVAVLLVLSFALVVAASASAVDPPPVISIDKMLQTGQAGYYEPGDSITWRYEITGNDAFVNVSVTDDLCSQVTPVLETTGPNAGYNVGDTITPYGRLNGLAGEKWIYTCTTTAPAWVNPGASSTNTAEVSGDSPWPVWASSNPFTDDDTFTLKAVALRKAVFIFWNYNVGVSDPAAGGVYFTVDVKNAGSIVGTETVSRNDPLYMWMAPGSWRLEERTPPAGYRIFDNRGTWNVNLADSWRDNSFINGSDFDLSISKSGPDIAFNGSTVTYTYEATKTGPAGVVPVVTDNKCSPVTFVSGDTIDNDWIDATETWTFTCTYTPTNWSTLWPSGVLTNTATVVAAEADDLSPAYPGGPIFGGDTNAANNTATFSLYPFVLRKEVGLYNDGAYPNFGAFADNTSFSVNAYKSGVFKATFTISEQSPKQMWLAAGTWTFQEFNLPQGYFAFYPNATITFTTGSYPDWTHLNVTWSGCSHGYWKNHTEDWPAPYTPLSSLTGVFGANALAGSFADALAFPGGSGTVGAKQILLRQAVAALLNEAKYGSAFGPYSSTGALISAVNTALGGNRGAMLSLAETLDHWNNGVCR